MHGGAAKDQEGAGGDTLVSIENLTGSSHGDYLTGNGQSNRLIGRKGADVLAGDQGADKFVYLNVKDSMHVHSDLIADLHSVDVINPRAIDANTVKGGDQAFHLVTDFTGHTGEPTLGLDALGNTVIRGHTDGDGKANLVAHVSGDHTGFTHFIL